jgi:hypothetical protein
VKRSSFLLIGVMAIMLVVLVACPTATTTGPNIALFDVTTVRTAVNPGDTVDFGTVIAFDTSTHNFSLENTGGTDLTLTGTTKVVITGASNYSIPVQPPPTVPAGGSVTFDIIFNNNTASGSTKNATIGIASDDPDIANLSFNVTGIDQVS